jgi:hypothetical protein
MPTTKKPVTPKNEKKPVGKPAKALSDQELEKVTGGLVAKPPTSAELVGRPASGSGEVKRPTK